MFYRLRCYLLLVALCLLATVQGQQVRDEGVMQGASTTAANKAAEESMIADWPTLSPDEDTGTQVWATGDFYNNDFVLVTYKSYGHDKLLEVAKSLARALNRPQTDFILTRGRRLICVDLEFNKFIKANKGRSVANIEIGNAMTFLKASDLPKPLGLFVRKNSIATVTIDGKQLPKSDVYDISRMSPDAILRIECNRSPYGWISALALDGFFLCAPLALFAFVGRTVMKSVGTSALSASSPSAPTSISENQQKYEQGKAKVSSKFLIGFLPVMALMPIGMRFVEKDSEGWLTPAMMEITLKVMMGEGAMIFVGFGILVARKKIKLKLHPEIGPATPRPTPPVPFTIFIPIFLMVGMVFFVRSSYSLLIPLPILRGTIFGTLGLSLVFVLIGIVRRANKVRTRLEPGDPIYDYTMETAKQCGVRVFRVSEIRADKPNAFATLVNTVGVTSGLREGLSEQEQHAVLAHEIGHLKNRHVLAIFVLTLVINAIYISILLNFTKKIETDYPAATEYMFASPMLFNILILLLVQVTAAPLKKRNEHSADLFALKAIGSYSIVATALAKIHLLGGAPHTYVGFDTLAGSHPSLMKRLDSLRLAAKELGLAVDDEPLRMYFEGQNSDGLSGMEDPADSGPSFDVI